MKNLVREISKRLQEKDCRVEVIFENGVLVTFLSEVDEIFGASVVYSTGEGFNINFDKNITNFIKKEKSDIKEINYFYD